MLGSGLRKECKIQKFEMNFWPRFDTCISFNVQPIDLKLKTRVLLDFNGYLCRFLHWGCCIGVVLSRHLDRSKRKARLCQDLVMSRYRLFDVDVNSCASNFYVDLIRKLEEWIPSWKVVGFFDFE